MAAADVSGSLAGVRATKGLFFIFTLLSLVYVAHSLEAKGHLEMLTKYHQGGINEAAIKKAQLSNKLARFIKDFQLDIDEINVVAKQLEAITGRSHYLKELPKIINDFLDETIEEVNDDIKAYLKEMEDIWNIIKIKEKKLS